MGDGKFYRSWPKQQLYYDVRSQLGQTLKGIFAGIGMDEALRLSTGTALIFFQCKSKEVWRSIALVVRKELEQFSRKHCLEFVRLMRPRLVVAIGHDAFSALVKDPSKVVKLNRMRIVQVGWPGLSRQVWGSFKLDLCGGGGGGCDGRRP